MSSLNKSLLIPLVIFIVLVAILAGGFGLKDPHFLPSQLIDQPFPDFSLSELNDPSRELTASDLRGQVVLVNVWATWCPNCLIEHPELLRISREEGVPLLGINYNDDSSKARQWLVRHNNPFQFNIVDAATLLAAQACPEDYKDLLVRMAGYSDYFNDMNADLQQEVIDRTENEVF